MFNTWLRLLGLAALAAAVCVSPLQAANPADSGGGLWYGVQRCAAWLDQEDEAYEGDDCCFSECDACCGCCEPGVSVDFGYLCWQAVRTPPYALVETAAGSRVFQNEYVSSDWDNGFRLNLGYLTRGGWDIGFEYTYYHNSAGEALTGTPGNPVFATQAHPLAGLGGVALVSATAASSLDYDVYDLTFGRTWQPADTLLLRGFGGLRWGQMSNASNIIYTGGQGDTITSTSAFRSWGLRGGGQMDWKIAGSDFGLFSRAAVSVLYAEMNGSRIESAALTPDVMDAARSVAPVLEVAAGVNYERGPFNVSLGYELTNWFNMVSEIQPVDGVLDVLKMDVDRGDLGLHGFFFRAGFVY